jgi:ergothioneine biosynthesis protein EgtB
MTPAQAELQASSGAQTPEARFASIRARSRQLCATLEPEDQVVQSMDDVSPTKWHLAHTTWFFEKFLLEGHLSNYRRFSDGFHYLFNSYYQTVGSMHARPRRGLLSRPGVAEILDYREHVDRAMASLLNERGDDAQLRDLVTLGLNHEQQHQELILTDIKHVFSCNPLRPALRDDLRAAVAGPSKPLQFITGATGSTFIGADGNAFCFDNETPRHETLLRPHALGSRLVTNGEFREFIRDGGYTRPEHWLADGWDKVRDAAWDRPLYWNHALETEFTLGGERKLDLAAPVSHVSYYEADAYARWAGARLPTEAEWENAAAEIPVEGNLARADHWTPVAASGDGNAVDQLFGDVWEWCASAYAPYPGFRPLEGSLGEYNGKFMCNQMTVRGGSCVTDDDHIRASYRSFFYPDARWQFLGFRLARDEN